MINELEIMKGLVFKKAETRWSGNQYVDERDDVLEFVTVKGDKFMFEHNQDCCEGVWIEEIHGDLSDLVGEPILLAEEISFHPSENETYENIRPDVNEWGKLSNESSESSTWTFYKFATIKGSVTLRWLGQSNGYYSESVDLCHDPYFLNDLPAYATDIYNRDLLAVSAWFYENDIGSPMDEKEETLFKLRFL